MNKIETIEALSETLSRGSILVEPKRCSFIRNWDSACTNCLDACPHGAIKRRQAHLYIDEELCTECGACCASCPTGTMVTTAPTMAEIVKQVRISASKNSGLVVFACTQCAVAQHIDSSKVIVLPCLNYLDEYLLVGFFAVDVKSVIILPADHTACQTGGDTPYFDTALKNASRLLQQWNIAGTIKVLGTVPCEYILPKGAHTRTAIRSDRREAFRQAGSAALGWFADAISETIGVTTQEPTKKTKTDQPIIVTSDEIFDIKSYRSGRLLAMLDHLGLHPSGEEIESRFWADVQVNPDLCKFCGSCSRMCATQALKYMEHEDETGTLTFEPTLCMGCHLCRDYCLSHSMIYSERVAADDLCCDTVKVLFDHAVADRTDFF